MRTLVIDTETTGLSKDDRIIELAAVELIDNKRTGVIYHAWYNPERPSHPKALEVHGLTEQWLSDKPKFEDLIDVLHKFLKADLWVIHNASFDLRFMINEFAKARRLVPYCEVFCTLNYARKTHDLTKSTLNGLCAIYGVDTSHRTIHGALTDAELLADLYLKMEIK